MNPSNFFAELKRRSEVAVLCRLPWKPVVKTGLRC